MKNLYFAMQRFLSEEDGVTAIEYALIASLIAVVIIAIVGATGGNIQAVFARIADCLDTSGCT